MTNIYYPRKMKVNLGMSEEEFSGKSTGQYIKMCRDYLEAYDVNYVTARDYKLIVGIAYGLLRKFSNDMEGEVTITLPPTTLDHKVHIVSNTRAVFNHCTGHKSVKVFGYFEDVREDKEEI